MSTKWTDPTRVKNLHKQTKWTDPTRLHYQTNPQSKRTYVPTDATDPLFNIFSEERASMRTEYTNVDNL